MRRGFEFLLSFLMFFSLSALGAGSSTVTRTPLPNGGEKVVIAWTADAADGSVPTRSISLYGYVQKIVTNPGSTAPTTLYDMALGDPSDSALDALAGALANRHTTTTEQVYPAIAGTIGTVSAFQVYLAGTYLWALTNNSVNSATGTVEIYLTK
jgi:hypothetical protein